MAVERIGGDVWVGTVVVLGGGPGDDVGAVVRARASILAEVELERLNLQHKGVKDSGREEVGEVREKEKIQTGEGAEGEEVLLGWGGGRGIAELDACKIRSQKMMCDQVLWTADNMMMDT